MCICILLSYINIILKLYEFITLSLIPVLVKFVFISDLLFSLKWLLCYYLKKTNKRVQDLKEDGYTDFMVRNDSQLFFARTLSLIYGEVRNYFFCFIIYQFGSNYFEYYFRSIFYLKLSSIV